nr:cation:proton antiporter [Clostridiales bacterium]
LKNTGGMACVIAILGVFVPVLGCGAIYYFFFIDSFSFENIIRTAFVGVVFAATSVSITVEALNEMGKLKTKVGATILNAAIIDDIIGIVVLSVVMGVADSSVNPLLTVGKIVLFFIFAGAVGFIIYKIFKKISVNHGKSRRIAVWALAFCFVMSFLAEYVFGVADITGAYVSGVILCNLTKSRQFLAKKMTVASYVLFSPVFFANIGLKTDLSGFTSKIAIFAVLLVIMSIVTKIAGCGLAAKICGLKSRESLTVGIGMVARGEVALMIAQKGIDAGYIDKAIFPAIVLCVIVAALTTPIMLKLSYKGVKDEENSLTAEENAR